jgi:O-antigen/teichoic acid export membrane protein
MSVPAARSRLHRVAARLRWPSVGRTVASTAAFNVALIGALGLGGVILARTVGPTVRGEYAAITAWFDVALVIGQCGQPAALCFYVARDPLRARQYAATSRVLLLASGGVVVAAGLLFTPVLAAGSTGEAEGYRIALLAAGAAFAGTAYVSSLQARDMRRWNVVRVSQPLLSLLAITVLWALGLLTLHSALAVLAVSMFFQLGYAYSSGRRSHLAPGRCDARLLRPLLTYGLGQLVALAPLTLNAQLGQLVLSQTVPSADLGRYAIAVSLTLLPVPLVSAIGNVAFPRLAALGVVTSASRRLQLLAVICSAGIAGGILLPLGAAAYWMVPLIFGAGYQGAVPLFWVLIPGGIFSACGQVVADLLRGGDNLAALAWAQCPAAASLIVLLVVLLPVVGVMGAAIASTVAYGVAFTIMLCSLWRRTMLGQVPVVSGEISFVEASP